MPGRLPARGGVEKHVAHPGKWAGRSAGRGAGGHRFGVVSRKTECSELSMLLPEVLDCLAPQQCVMTAAAAVDAPGTSPAACGGFSGFT